MSVKAWDAGFDMERHAFLSGYYRAYLYGAHRCYRCEKCALDEGADGTIGTIGKTKRKSPVKDITEPRKP
jgi:predicted metal-binding protein